MKINKSILDAINSAGPIKYDIVASDFDNGPVPVAFVQLMICGDQFYGEPIMDGVIAKDAGEANDFLIKIQKSLQGIKEESRLADRVMAVAFLEFVYRLKDIPGNLDRIEYLSGICGTGRGIMDQGEEVYNTPQVWPERVRDMFNNYLLTAPLKEIFGQSDEDEE